MIPHPVAPRGVAAGQGVRKVCAACAFLLVRAVPLAQTGPRQAEGPDRGGPAGKEVSTAEGARGQPEDAESAPHFRNPAAQPPMMEYTMMGGCAAGFLKCGALS